MIDDSIRQFVRVRAAYRCEYCRLKQEHSLLWQHQIEHIIPRKHHGSDELENLALACVRCNLGKSSNLTGRDPVTGKIAELFNPRSETWLKHFKFENELVIGVTPTGKVTADVLNMNEAQRLTLRLQLYRNGELD
jgi:hypothetical protein